MYEKQDMLREIWKKIIQKNLLKNWGTILLLKTSAELLNGSLRKSNKIHNTIKIGWDKNIKY